MKSVAPWFIALALSAFSGATLADVEVYANAPSPVRHAANELSKYTGIPVGLDRTRAIRLVLNERPNPRLGNQGYSIRSQADAITISANDDEGIANGVFTLIRTMMLDHLKDPHARQWNIEEKPQFSTRALLVAPYRFGAMYGFAELSPDRWSFGQWKEYVDLMRLTNMTTLTMASERVYHPDYPNSTREKWRYEVWKQVMDYCHQVGMKFNWFIAPNLVTEQAFWDNPDMRASQEAGNWYGNGLDWRKAKDLILENQRYTFEYFSDMDALEIIFSDGGGFSVDDPDPAGYIADATNSYRSFLRQLGNDADFVFWNWVLDYWGRNGLPERVREKYPVYKTLQDDVIPLLPKDVVWLDTSALTLIQFMGLLIQDDSGDPNFEIRETALLGKENGFKSTIDFFWYMNPELPINLFPHPYIGRTLQEAHYARDELGADGVMGYRLAPPIRFINDYAYFRLASDPSLTEEQLITEAAAMLAEKPENQKLLAEAITNIEAFWSTHDRTILEKAEATFNSVRTSESSKRIEYIANGLTFLTYIDRMSEPGIAHADREAIFNELYATIKGMYIFQGLVADIVWIPEAVPALRARVQRMIDTYKYGYRYNPYDGVIDRSIYPKATSKPYKPNWTPRWPESYPDPDTVFGDTALRFHER